jgi:hypothetical protein
VTESSRLRFDLYSWGILTVLLIATGVYFAFNLAWNLTLVSFLLVGIGAFSAVAGFCRTWRKSPFGSSPVGNDSLPNPKVRIFRCIVWVLLMCIAGSITALFAPNKAIFVPSLFLVLFVPMVLLPIRNSGKRNSPIKRSDPTSNTGIELLWLMGNCIWCATVPLLWWHGYEAQTAAQASLNSTRLLFVSGIGGLWSIAGGVWLAKLRKTRKT